MFFLRSAFWLTLLFSAMPFEQGETSRAINPAAISCRALATTACVAAPAMCRDRSGQDASGKGRVSADGLTVEDRATPWRGRPGVSGA